MNWNMKDKDKLLELLDDPDVISKIRSVFQADSAELKCQPAIEQGKYSEEDLKNRLEQCSREVRTEYQEKLNNITEQYKKRITEFETELNTVSYKAEQSEKMRLLIEKKYELEEKLYSIYCSFTTEQMSWFDRVLHSDSSRSNSPVELIVWATQKENLVAFWEIATSHLSEIDSNNQTEIFYMFFEKCFSLYAATTRGKATLILPRRGEEYDPLKHSKSSDSRSSGNISRVIFPGYIIGNENNKPIVKVE